MHLILLFLHVLCIPLLSLQHHLDGSITRGGILAETLVAPVGLWLDLLDAYGNNR